MTPNLTASSSPTDDKPQTPSAPPSPRPNTDQAIPRHHPAAPPHVAPTLEPASAHHAQAPAPVSSPADLASAPTPTPAPNHPSHMPPPPPSSSSVSSFRNVSACNRCRLRKNRCDQRLPACASCEKAHVKCVGYDPITKKEIPRSYVYYLESRIAYLHSLLRDHDIPFAPPEHFALSYKPPNGHAIFGVEKQAQAAAAEDQQQYGASSPHVSTTASPKPDAAADADASRRKEQRYDESINKMVSNIGMVSVQGASDPRYLGSTSGISFARVVFAAVKSSVSGGASSEKSKPLPGSAVGTSMRDSFFGLHTKPTIRQAPFPERELASRLVELYFEHANPQVPILHRGEYMAMFERVLNTDPKERTSRELYMLNIVFAIGAGIILDSSDSHDRKSSKENPETPPPGKRRRLSSIQQQPEEYYASAIVHLESFLASSSAVDRPDGFGGGLEELQAVLLLAGFALLRPVAPGLWYIVGVAVRLGVDLGLHYEDGVGIDGATGEELDPKERGRRQWVRDLRRRLWWCVYSLDRLVSTCVGRPFGISDQVITTEFPSSLDDRFITKEGFVTPGGDSTGGSVKPTYKCVSYHYFRFRMLQSEILQVLQSRQAQQVRSHSGFLHTDLPNPFLARFGDSFVSWRRDIDRRLYEWKESAPTQLDTGVQFSPLFFELNYWQAVIMLYRPSLTVPGPLADELSKSATGPAADDDVGNSPSVLTNNSFDEREDDDFVFLKVAEAGQMTLKLYRQLHRVHLVNYTYLATHHLFMAGKFRINLGRDARKSPFLGVGGVKVMSTPKFSTKGVCVCVGSIHCLEEMVATGSPGSEMWEHPSSFKELTFPSTPSAGLWTCLLDQDDARSFLSPFC
ncbi:fungal-specific transcription factor domain-containing protein [Phyllosticta capitalensis]|uniref:fungal-specific transcription factor domain-containing protein n=1 Tax=Phyllosticta capitalensis TaxID=121624 RepID=UPI003130D997